METHHALPSWYKQHVVYSGDSLTEAEAAYEELERKLLAGELGQ